MEISGTHSLHSKTPNNNLWQVSQELESVFLSQMLKPLELGKAENDFSGGIGEDQFQSLLLDQHAKAITAAGGVGLAENIYNSLVTGQ